MKKRNNRGGHYAKKKTFRDPFLKSSSVGIVHKINAESLKQEEIAPQAPSSSSSITGFGEDLDLIFLLKSTRRLSGKMKLLISKWMKMLIKKHMIKFSLLIVILANMIKFDKRMLPNSLENFASFLQLFKFSILRSSSSSMFENMNDSRKLWQSRKEIPDNTARGRAKNSIRKLKVRKEWNTFKIAEN